MKKKVSNGKCIKFIYVESKNNMYKKGKSNEKKMKDTKCQNTNMDRKAVKNYL